MMKPAQRHEVILKYLRESHANASVDCLNRDFVDHYTETTGARYGVHMYGADKCPQLERDLATMKKQFLLVRHRVGIQGMAGMGFPKWVWSYSLPKEVRNVT